VKDLGHDVRMGARDPDASRARTEPGHAGAEPLRDWLDHNPEIQLVTFHDAVGGSDVLLNATGASVSLDVLGQAEQKDLEGKIVIDIANPIDFSSGELDLTVGITDSLAETLQCAHPLLRVVKTLNTVTAAVMVDPMFNIKLVR
jgi:predicted dinucleotide-binding enzyme